MMRCKVRPYHGNENYIFISYSHKDKDRVFPIIEKLDNDGYRVWYDEGIDPGSEWPETIAHYLVNCTVCLAFFTGNSMESHNCRREINFAILKEKNPVAVMLENVELSLGMQMQLSAIQSVFKYKMESDNDFFDQIYRINNIKSCKKNELSENRTVAITDNKKIRETADHNDALIRFNKKEDWHFEKADEKTQLRNVEKCAEPKGAVLIRLKTNERINLSKLQTTIGRRCDQPNRENVDYSIDSNIFVSRIHAKIHRINNTYYVSDCGSANKTYLNARELPTMKKYPLADGDTLRFANERFKFQIV